MSDKPKSILQLKTQEKIKHLLMEMFSKSEMYVGKDRIFISITNVDISPNLRNLKVYVDILNMDQKNKKIVVKKINSENIYSIKDLIAKKINLRYVPEIIFILDDSNEKIYKMNKIIEAEAKKISDEKIKK